jgi:hypothetical protein
MKFSEIKKLIDFCAKQGVSEISIGDFKVVFGGQTKASSLTLSSFQTKDDEVQTQQVEKEALEESSKELDQEDLAHMAVADPQRYEQLLIEGELEDDRAGDAIADDEQRAIDASLTVRPTRARAQAPQH